MTVRKAFWNQIESRDHRLMRLIHRWRAPRWFSLLMILSTRCGDGWLWYTVGITIFFYGGPHRFGALAASGSAALAGIVLFRVLKKTSHRQRPCDIEPHCWSSVLPPDRYSFPSGHSITAFAVAVSVGLFYPELMVSLLTAALLIAASRIILGMHFLSDVIVGSGFGVLLAVVSFHLFYLL